MMTRFGLAFLWTLMAAQLVHGAEFKVLSAIGEVSVVRAGIVYPVGNRQPLAAVDVVTTGAKGTASILAGGSVVYLGPGTTIQVPQQSDAIQIERGQARIANGTSTQFSVLTPDGEAAIGEGIFRVFVNDDGTRLASDLGNATARWPSRLMVLANYQGGQAEKRSIGTGQELVIPSKTNKSGASPKITKQQAGQPPVEVDALQKQAADAAQNDKSKQTTAQQQQQQQDASQRTADQDRNREERQSRSGENQSTSGFALASSGGVSASPGLSASAGLFADAAQSTNEGQIVANPPAGSAIGDPFPGNIHLVTGESRYAMSKVQLSASEAAAIFPTGDPVYFAIGTGAKPTTQVTTSFLTASAVVPEAVRIPHFDAYVLRYEQYGPTDAALDPAGAEANNVGFAGLVGTNPTAPVINGATPLTDERSKLNDRVTFALGEFRLRNDGGTGNDSFELAVRRSDQDRLIVKDSGGNDANDQVTPNPDVGAYDDVADPRFQPAAPTVKVPSPGTYSTAGTQVSQLNTLRRAAATTILADQLHDFAQRTGQTRFVVDGRIIDISGYKKH